MEGDSMMASRRRWLLPLLFALIAALPLRAEEDPPRNVIVMISDGMGPAAVTLARLFAPEGRLALDEYLVGASITHSERHLVTDSAAAGTAIASGVRTFNGALNLDPAGRPVLNVMTAARRQRQMATGIVVTCILPHATPAAFSAVAPSRSQYLEIAAQQAALPPDVAFGGGRRWFLPVDAGGLRTDGRNLLDALRENGVTVIRSREEFDGPLQPPVWGLFSGGDLNYEIDRVAPDQPSLAEMVRRAIELLSSRPEPFFLMVEGSKIDHAAHANDAATMVKDILAYDEAFAAAVAFARRDGRTLVVSLSDHETGGLTIVGGTWNPESRGPLRLRDVKASTARMARLIADARLDPEAVLSEMAGITDATAEELAPLRKRKAAAAELTKPLAAIVNRRLALAWSTGGHSAVDVGVYAFGPGRERFRGAHPHARIARAIADLLGLDLAQPPPLPEGVPPPAAAPRDD